MSFRSLEKMLRWYGGAKVVHRNNDSLIFEARRNGVFAIGSTVGYCIGDQVADELIEPITVGSKVTLSKTQLGQLMPGERQTQLVQTVGHQFV